MHEEVSFTHYSSLVAIITEPDETYIMWVGGHVQAGTEEHTQVNYKCYIELLSSDACL